MSADRRSNAGRGNGAEPYRLDGPVSVPRTEASGDEPAETSAAHEARERRQADARENFAALQALIEAEFTHLDDRLGALMKGGEASTVHVRMVLAKRTPDGHYEVRERAIVAELGEAHTTLATLLAMAADACRDDFGDAKTEDFLRRLAEHHETDAGMLRALLREG